MPMVADVRYALVDARLTTPYGSGSPWVALDLVTGSIREPRGPLAELPAALIKRGASGATLPAAPVLDSVTAFFCTRYQHTDRPRILQPATAPPPAASAPDLTVMGWLNGRTVTGHRRHPAAGDRGCVSVRAEPTGVLAVVGELDRLLPKYRQPRCAHLAFLEAGHVIENACLRLAADSDLRTLQIAPHLGPDLTVTFATLMAGQAGPAGPFFDWSADAPVLVPWNGAWLLVRLDGTVTTLTFDELAALTRDRVSRVPSPGLRRLSDAGWYGAFVGWLSRPPGRLDSTPAVSPLRFSLAELDARAAARRTTRSGFVPTDPSAVEELLGRVHADADLVRTVVRPPTQDLLDALGSPAGTPAPLICVLAATDLSEPLGHRLISLGRVAQRLCLLAREHGLGVWPIHPENDDLVRATCALGGHGPTYALGIGRVRPDSLKEEP